MELGTDRNILELQREIAYLRKEFEEFVYAVSHDLRTPLRAISNLSEWIAEDIEDNNADVQENLALLQNRAGRMERMVEGLLELSRVGREKLEVTTFDAPAAIDQIVQTYEPFAGSIAIDCRVAEVTTYKAKFIQTMHALIDNAVKYNDKGERAIITITMDAHEAAYAINVVDNGQGISHHEQGDVFKVFYTTHAKDEHDTTGVGLTLVQKIITYIGGSIALESAVGEGTSVAVEWPIANS